MVIYLIIQLSSHLIIHVIVVEHLIRLIALIAIAKCHFAITIIGNPKEFINANCKLQIINCSIN